MLAKFPCDYAGPLSLGLNINPSGRGRSAGVDTELLLETALLVGLKEPIQYYSWYLSGTNNVLNTDHNTLTIFPTTDSMQNL